jgi:hypothetical protein
MVSKPRLIINQQKKKSEYSIKDVEKWFFVQKDCGKKQYISKLPGKSDKWLFFLTICCD